MLFWPSCWPLRHSRRPQYLQNLSPLELKIRFGTGRFLVRGGELEHMEGDWRPKRVVVVEFESLDKARAFYRSPDYAEAIKIRQRTSISSVLIVQGA